ncbi:hypothetical protein M438DRAFT_154226 [Aureobasidium pullulans EXF-150]|uniref:Uncharacterized protein n=1 Tax=Aureobasidium pullulans EXF-150 TaxID=1043002 RepID=A0A074X0W2_AURPU|nr:uncharacterized protein M438DRAFT_154226 [Aureobasidium pullulans EXF-150]KEQ79080.1 hypothetical protein M438DRAFT_154226 [Aureobasidium pullulans EXF-150]
MRTCNHHLYSCAGRSCRWTFFFSLLFPKTWVGGFLHFCTICCFCSYACLLALVFSSWFFFFDMQICRFFFDMQMINPHFSKTFHYLQFFLVVWGFLS